MEKKYVIRDLKQEKYYYSYFFPSWTKDVGNAECYDTIEDAENVINKNSLELCTIITVYIPTYNSISSQL